MNMKKKVAEGLLSIGAVFFRPDEPFTCKKIIEDLPRVMEKYGIENLSDIIGGSH